MKCSESWLSEWVNTGLARAVLCDKLTMGGLEVEGVTPVSDSFSGIVIGQVLTVSKHPEADKLHLCDVSVGAAHPLKIVCGAANVREGLKVPVAVIGAVLANNKTIAPATIRGAASEGMLCSAVELGLAEESQGLLELADDAPLGKDLRAYLQLEDVVIDVSITPNRGDCLSIRGVARDVAALCNSQLTPINIPEVKALIKDTLSVKLEADAGCPRYVGRVIRNVKADVATPVWLKERLRRAGVRSINPIVDVTNYVMMELGQPMHAFDLDTLKDGIKVRLSKQGEKIALLDGSEQELDAETLVIADYQQPVAIAGVMGGLNSSVTSLTKNIFLESAYFAPTVVARQRQQYGLSSESAYRFERGVDSTMQKQAIERATQLIIDMVGGEAGPVVEEVSVKHLPNERIIAVKQEQVTQLLGVDIPDNEIEKIFTALGFKWKKESIFKKNIAEGSSVKDAVVKISDKCAWDVTVPSYRTDMSITEDVIEEIARIYGYNKIPELSLRAELHAHSHIKGSQDLRALRQNLSDQGLSEIISYSFVSKKLQSLLDPEETPKELLNPITSDMTVMRTNLLPGLITTLLYNKSRQQHRVRLFEIGDCFLIRGKDISHQPRVAGLIVGSAMPEQWGIPTREADFYDLKGIVEQTLSLAYDEKEIIFNKGDHPALHPGQSASIYHKDQKIGIMGALHPAILQELDLSDKVYVFELDLNQFETASRPAYQDVSKFPEIRRDLALLVNQTVPAKDIQDTIRVTVGDWLKEVFIFDVYQGKGISPGQKSVALGLVLQHPTRTLVDNEVAELMERVVKALQGQLGAELRS